MTGRWHHTEPTAFILEGIEQACCIFIARENQRNSMRIDLEVLNSFDLIITTSASDSECVSVSVNSNFGIRH